MRRNNPLAQPDSVTRHPRRRLDDRTGALHSQIVACRNSDPPASTSAVNRDASRGCRRSRSIAHATAGAPSGTGSAQDIINGLEASGYKVVL